MRPTDSSLGLGFLLSFGTLPIAACADGSDDDDGAASSPTSLGTNPSDDSASGTDDDTGTASDPSAGSDPTAGTASDPTAGTASDPTAGTASDPTAADDDTSATDPTAADSGTGGELPEACEGIAITPGCQAQSDKLAECYPRYARYYADYAIQCSCGVTYYADMNGGPACSTALDDLYACIGGLTCEQIGGEGPYCEAESAALDEVCDAGSTSSGGVTDDG